MGYFEQIHEKTKDLRYEGPNYDGKPIIIDACELYLNHFEVSVLSAKTHQEIETTTVLTLEKAKEEFDRMRRYHVSGEAEGMYGMAEWKRDRCFLAREGQEISPAIYENMRDALPPITLPRELRRRYSGGFMMGEPHDSDPTTGMNRYMAFITVNGHFYYAGLHPKK